MIRTNDHSAMQSIMIITQTRLQQLKPHSSSTVTRMRATELTKLKTAIARCIHTTSRYVTYRPAVSLGRTIFTTCKQVPTGIREHDATIGVARGGTGGDSLPPRVPD